MPDNIILFPDFEELKNGVEKMRTEASMLLLERDELQFVICKNIETKYMLELGAIEYRAYQAQCKALRLKRKIDLIQAKKNRQEKINLSVIEMVLDEEFAEYQKQLEEQVVEATAGGGAVTVQVSGKKEVLSVKLSEEVVDPDDVEMLEDLIMAATNEALRQIEEQSQASMSKITGGLGGGLF